MQIKSAHIRNFRSLSDVTIPISALTALLGENNAGKSTILKAIEIFFDASPRLTFDDAQRGKEDQEIQIMIEFNNLTPAEIDEFGTAIIDGEMLVTRQFKIGEKDSGHYSVRALVFEDFEEIRNEANGNRKRTIYRELQKVLDGLPDIQSHTEIENNLSAWEKANPDALTPKHRRGFFGFPNVANGKLKKKTSIHLIPAVRDAASETEDQKRSPILTLLSEIAKQIFENKEEMQQFLEKTRNQFSELVDPGNVPQLGQISEHLTESVRKFYQDSKLNALWEPGEGINVAYPVPRIAVEDRGVVTDLSRVGHGLQRAALFAIVQFLAEQVSGIDIGGEVGGSGDAPAFAEPASDIIIMIEEPEIYQHPSKQFVISRAFEEICNAFNKETGIRVQIIYTTHSEKFVKMESFESVRIIRKIVREDEITNTIANLYIDSAINDFANYFVPPRVPMTRDAFLSKLHIFTREVCEGFFGRKIILVEGVTDRAALEAVYLAKGRDVFAESISIIPVDGKTKMDRPAYIFSQLGIPTYIIFDNDFRKKEKHQRAETNILLQRICGSQNPQEFPDVCGDMYAAFEGKLEDYLEGTIGDIYNELITAIALDYDLGSDYLKKTPSAMAKLILLALGRGCSFPKLDEIVEKVDSL